MKRGSGQETKGTEEVELAALINMMDCCLETVERESSFSVFIIRGWK